jgi:small-conductance mechanosensitive channel
MDRITDLLAALGQPSVLFEAVAIVLCVVVAWLVAWRTRRDPSAPRGTWTSQHAANSAVFPVLAFGLLLLVWWVLRGQMTITVLPLALTMLATLAVVRVVARALRAMFPTSRMVLTIERTFSWVLWGGMVLWVTGVLPSMLTEAEGIKWSVGGSLVSLRSLLEGVVSAAAVMVVALWLSSVIESRLLTPPLLTPTSASTSGGPVAALPMTFSASDMSLRKIAANTLRVLLLLVGLLLALTAAGIPVGALGVLGGAIGVGIGLGLQKLAANYVSGFVVLAERRLRIGDQVKVDGFEGHITDIATRYTVVRAADGRESIVPNEMLVTQRVENHATAQKHGTVSCEIVVAHGSDVATLMPRLQEAIASCDQVLAHPAPTVRLLECAPAGLHLALQVSVVDAGNQQSRVKSDMNLAVLRTLAAQGVTLAVPRRSSDTAAARPA